jgi:tetratricopeptide (TPR) repeat protein
MKFMKFIIISLMTISLLINQKVKSCTVFYSNDGENVFAGNNEDFRNNRKSEIWFTKAQKGEYGCVFWGYKYSILKAQWIPQGGMNEKGLFMDATSVREIEILSDEDKKNAGPFFLHKILKECATVDEVVNLLGNYNLKHVDNGQIFIADKSGDYAIIDNNKITRKSDMDYCVITNFRISSPKVGLGRYPCIRHEKVNKMLDANPEASYSNFEKMLKSVQLTGPTHSTLYSTICDLKKGEIKLYQFHDFENPIKFNLSEELKKGNHKFFIADLFPQRISSVLLETNNNGGFEAAYNQLVQFDKEKKYNVCESEMFFFAENLIWQNQVKEAFKVYQFALSKYPNSDVLLWKTGLGYLQKGDSDIAVSYFKKAYKINSFNEKVERLIEQIENPVKEANTVFRLKGYEDAKIVTVRMNTDNWEDYMHIMHKKGDEWVYNTDLNKGTYEYCFMVDGGYVPDPNNPNTKLFSNTVVFILEKED